MNGKHGSNRWPAPGRANLNGPLRGSSRSEIHSDEIPHGRQHTYRLAARQPAEYCCSNRAREPGRHCDLLRGSRRINLWRRAIGAHPPRCKSAARRAAAPAIQVASLRRRRRRGIRSVARLSGKSRNADRSQRHHDRSDRARPQLETGYPQYNRIQSSAWIADRRLANTVRTNLMLQRMPISLALIVTFSPFIGAQELKTWQAGVAKTVITPKQLMWMSGYGARNKPAEGKLHDLWAKALVLQDAAGKRCVLVTMDLVGIDAGLTDDVCADLKKQHGLEREQIMLSVSHTHCGPVVGKNLIAMYSFDDKQHALVKSYTKDLHDKHV